MTAEANLRFWLVVWLGTAVYILVRHWRTGRGAGLVFTYVFSFGAIHWLAPVMYLLPWYLAPTLQPTVEGLRVATVGLVAFAVGGEVGAALFRHWGPYSQEVDRAMLAEPRVVNLYIVAGAIFYGAIFPLVSRLPTASALASTASSLMVLGVALKAWNGWQRARPLVSWMWLAASAAFPFITLVGQGFLGFGFAAMLVVAAFVANFYRPRWLVVAVGLLVAYGGLSVYVTYMRDRRDIRAVVWGGESIASRVDRLGDTFANTEWFDINNIDHLRRVDERLNQDYLVGEVVEGIQSGVVPLAHGSTIADAILALVPRALWPEKPVAAGSGDLVSTYTGLVFAEGTSVGIGHVMESYVNFGMAGVFGGLLLLGAITVYVDRSASFWLYHGDVSRFAIWFLPGLSLLQVGGSFVEMTSSAAAGLVVAVAFKRFTGRLVDTPAALVEPDAEPVDLP